ncbi:MAG: hypothetical protein Tsb0034_12250 [Ekhidna sp.]
MKRIKIGDVVETDYGVGRVLAVTKEWFIHDDSSNGRSTEFAISILDDEYKILKVLQIQH